MTYTAAGYPVTIQYANTEADKHTISVTFTPSMLTSNALITFLSKDVMSKIAERFLEDNYDSIIRNLDMAEVNKIVTAEITKKMLEKLLK